MSRLLAPSSIRRCSTVSRSFLLGPDGPAGPPPGHRLRSGSYMAAKKNRDQGKISPIDVSTLSGEPRVWSNCYNVLEAALPFGGYKQPGWCREMGHEVLNNYTEVKAVTTAVAGQSRALVSRETAPVPQVVRNGGRAPSDLLNPRIARQPATDTSIVLPDGYL
jgi:hypothetical protein